MGREAVAVCHWQGEIAEAKVHLDSRFLQLRGQMRLDLPRDAIRAVDLDDAGVLVRTQGGDLMMEFGAVEAARWQKAILKKPPTLAEKLRISAQTPAFVQGTFDDAPLAEALSDATVGDPADAMLLVAVLLRADDLQQASDLALAHPDKHIWVVHQKGKAAVVGDSTIRSHMRGLGFIDSKTSAVSDQLTTTRYRQRT
ncbi:hypothetical protein [Loktanella sp. Alg231-35]|uniref:hypothetical protein n=1 Tax=Loktanella sp. Alg231-35 TaxID=1922220 RepID=UPI000D5514A1|nr:hypothetical protein [Loktanella sp. Alg231-35]